MTVPQHMQALAEGQERRVKAADFRRQVRQSGRRGGALKIVAVLDAETIDTDLGCARIGLLLRAVPQLGERSAMKCLVAARVENPEARLRDLSPTQRVSLAFQLEAWAS